MITPGALIAALGIFAAVMAVRFLLTVVARNPGGFDDDDDDDGDG